MNGRGCLAVSVSFFLSFFVAFAGCHEGQAEPSSLTNQAPGLRAWIDPETGRLGVPQEPNLPEHASGSAAAGIDGLQLVPGKTGAGGMMVDLRGHFAYGRRASVSPGGIVADCDLHHEAGDE
jgi:hypothetical protein